MLSDTIIINGKSLESFSFYPARADGFLSGQNVKYSEVQVPGTAGVAVVNPAGQLEPRVLQIDGRVDVNTPGELFPAIQALLSHLFFGPLEVSTAHDFNLVYYARVEDQPIVAYEPQMLSTDASLSLRLRCADPLVYERSARVIGFGATPVPIPVGTGWTSGVVRITNATNPILRVRRGNGVLVQEIPLTITLGAADFVTIDSPGRLVQKTVAGVTTSALSTLGTFADYPMVISPLDGDTDNPPTIEVTSGVGEFSFRRTFL